MWSAEVMMKQNSIQLSSAFTNNSSIYLQIFRKTAIAQILKDEVRIINYAFDHQSFPITAAVRKLRNSKQYNIGLGAVIDTVDSEQDRKPLE